MKSQYYKLQKKVWLANQRLVKEGLVKLTWGNVSQISDDGQVFAIKPSGVDYQTMQIKDIVLIDMKTGQQIFGNLNPSTDTPTHWFLYDHFPDLKGICHTHSVWATTFAQMGKEIQAFGTTHADCFEDDIHCTRDLTMEEIDENYELSTGKVIFESFQKNKNHILRNPAIIAKNHGLFTFGKSAKNAVDNAVITEFVAKMAYHTLNYSSQPLNPELFKKHNERKWGENAYYGQKDRQKKL